MRILARVVLGMCALLTLGSANAVDQAYIDGGALLRPTGKRFPGVVDIGLGWNLPWSWNQATLTSRLDLGLGLIRNKDYHTWTAQAMTVLRYQPAASRHGVFAELGIGASYLDKTMLAAEHDMGSHLQFEERLGVGYDFYGQELSLNFNHISNAGLDHPNPGANTASIRYTQSF